MKNFIRFVVYPSIVANKTFSPETLTDLPIQDAPEENAEEDVDLREADRVTFEGLKRRARGYEVRYERLSEEAVADMLAAMDVTEFSEVSALGSMMRVQALRSFYQGLVAFNSFLEGDLKAIKRAGDDIANYDYAEFFAHFPLYRKSDDERGPSN